MMWLIKGGLVLDGSGCRGRRADVLVTGDRIAAVAPALTGGDSVIDASGLVVAPGFIDSHSHGDRTIFSRPRAQSAVMQGVTTAVIGNCGCGFFPVSGRHRHAWEAYFPAAAPWRQPPVTWEDMAGFAHVLEQAGPGLNLVCLMPHGVLRTAVMGTANREAAAEELGAMKNLLAASLEQGAWGLSTGLTYPPCCFASTSELVELAETLAACGAAFAIHVRGEGGLTPAALEEAVAIAAGAGVRTVVSHLQAIGRPNWEQERMALARLMAARAAGVNIWADRYPYEAAAASLTALLPEWTKKSGPVAMLWHLADADLHGRIRLAVREAIEMRGGPENIWITSVRGGKNEKYAGRTLAQVAWDRLLAPEDAAVRLIAEEGGAVEAVYFSLGHGELAALMASDIVAVASNDAWFEPTADAARLVHPRAYGAFPRVLGRFVREQGVLSLEAAVRKMTALPAAIFGLRDRGLIRSGFAADIVIFAPKRVCDRADFVNPHQYPAGIEYVFVNGVPAVAGGRLTGEGGGRVLRRSPDCR